MREIKFRAWHGISGIMTYSYHLDSLEKFFGAVENYGVVQIMQYTGLKDKNGKEIYEGDVVLIHHKHSKWDGKESTWQVVTEETSWGYAFSWEHISGYECSTHVMEDSPCNYEVIGNIYENPELLESGK